MTEARLNAILDDVQRALVDVITRHRVTAEEFRAATEFLAEAGQQHLEIPLLLDVFLASAVDDVAHAGDGTESNIEGPLYVAGAPTLEPPYVLPRRADEPGEKLIFSGTVRSTDGSPLAGATLDVGRRTVPPSTRTSIRTCPTTTCGAGSRPTTTGASSSRRWSPRPTR